MISVIIPTYNHRDHVLPALESVFAQSYSDYEVIVVNDGSPDDTHEVLRQLVEEGRIRYFEQPNAGQASARNRGLAAARGDFIAYLDDDDVWPPDKLEWQMELLARHPEAVMVYGDEVVLRRNGELGAHRLVERPSGAAREAFLLKNRITTLGQTLIRTDALRVIGGFDPDIWASDDWEMYLRLARVGPFVHEPRVAVHYRLHDANASRSAVRHVRNHFKAMRKHMGGNLPLIVAHLRACADYFVWNLTNASLMARSERRYAEALNAQFYALLFRPRLIFDRRFLRPFAANLVRRPPRS